MPNITVHEIGVIKLLRNRDIHKAAGPDQKSARLLKETVVHMTPAILLLFQALLSQGKLPEE